MSSGGGAGKTGNNSRGVSIPSNVRKTIQNIKEITGNHSEEDIYLMLKECSMDPNETTQKLLLQDTFHEVRRKRDRKKESQSRDHADSRCKPGMQGRGNKGGRGTHSSRNISYDSTAGGRNSASAEDSAPNQDSYKGLDTSFSSASLETKSFEATYATSLSISQPNGPTSLVSGSTAIVHDVNTSTYSDSKKLLEQLAPQANKSSANASGALGKNKKQAPNSSDSLTSAALGISSTQDLHLSGAVETSKIGVGITQPVLEEISANNDRSILNAGASEFGSSSVQGKVPSKPHGVGKNQHVETSQTTSVLHNIPSVCRPSSSYGSRSQMIGPQKVGPSKEWKPKSTVPNLTQGSRPATPSEVPAIPVEANTELPTALKAVDPKGADMELKTKLEEIRISGGQQHVIIPNHLHVPEVEKLGFCFGSFDASFGANTSYSKIPENKTSPVSEISGESEETTDEQFSSNQNAFGTVDEVDYADNNQSSAYGPENLSSNDGGVSTSNVPDSDSKQENTAEGHEYSSNNNSNYGVGLVPPMLGSQLPPFENSDGQTRDLSRFPAFVVQQPFDPTSYYAQFYRSGSDIDGRISPFHPGGGATKYSGNLNILSPQTSQSQQEIGNPTHLSAAAPTPLASQGAGIMQSSMGLTQPLSVFRPPAGLHLQHYPSNYIPYGHYISPLYIQPPAIHQFIGNGAFPQQPQGGNVYPALPAAAKYSVLQYKPGNNTTNSNHAGIPGCYVTYSSPVGNYNLNSATTAGNSTSNDDLATHFKENNTYSSGPQNEGSGTWISPPGRDVSNIQTSSFYNLPQGQMAFAAAQPGNGTFAGLYHPAPPVNAATVHPLLQQPQTMASSVDMVGPTASVYQQPQHSQINWPSNF